MGKENPKSLMARVAGYFLVPTMIFFNTGFARSPNKEIQSREWLTISNHYTGFEDANTLFVGAETTGYEGVGITLKATLINPNEADPDKRVIILKELGVPKFNDEDRPRYDMTGYKDGIYIVEIEAKKGDDWEKFQKYDKVVEVFYFSHCIK